MRELIAELPALSVAIPAISIALPIFSVLLLSAIFHWIFVPDKTPDEISEQYQNSIDSASTQSFTINDIDTVGGDRFAETSPATDFTKQSDLTDLANSSDHEGELSQRNRSDAAPTNSFDDIATPPIRLNGSATPSPDRQALANDARTLDTPDAAKGTANKNTVYKSISDTPENIATDSFYKKQPTFDAKEQHSNSSKENQQTGRAGELRRFLAKASARVTKTTQSNTFKVSDDTNESVTSTAAKSPAEKQIGLAPKQHSNKNTPSQNPASTTAFSADSKPATSREKSENSSAETQGASTTATGNDNSQTHTRSAASRLADSPATQPQTDNANSAITTSKNTKSTNLDEASKHAHSIISTDGSKPIPDNTDADLSSDNIAANSTALPTQQRNQSNNNSNATSAPDSSDRAKYQTAAKTKYIPSSIEAQLKLRAPNSSITTTNQSGSATRTAASNDIADTKLLAEKNQLIKELEAKITALQQQTSSHSEKDQNNSNPSTNTNATNTESSDAVPGMASSEAMRSGDTRFTDQASTSQTGHIPKNGSPAQLLTAVNTKTVDTQQIQFQRRYEEASEKLALNEHKIQKLQSTVNRLQASGLVAQQKEHTAPHGRKTLLSKVRVLAAAE